MSDDAVVPRAQDLSDVELAMLLSLIARQHCIIQTESEALDALEEEIKLIAINVFGLSFASIQCSASTTLEDFSNGLLIDSPAAKTPTTPKNRASFQRASSYKFERSFASDNRQVAQVFVAKNLNQTIHQVQMQALELLRTHRIFTHTGVHAVPKPFLLIVLGSISSVPLSKHLNDMVFISHYHRLDEGFLNTEESSEWIEDDRASISSIVHKTVTKSSLEMPLLSAQDVESLARLSEAVVISTEVTRYIHDVLTFLRMHRAVASGVTARATKHLELLVRCLTPLHGLSFPTPSIIGLAAQKIYAHRLVLATAEGERSMQYGSDSTAVAAVLDGITVSMVIEEVLLDVEVPL